MHLTPISGIDFPRRARNSKRWQRASWLVAVLAAAALAGCASGSVPPSTSGAPASLAASDRGSPAADSGSPPADQGSLAGQGSSASGTPSAPAVAPSPGAVLATVQDIGATRELSNPQGDGFTAIHDVLGQNYAEASTLDTYDVAGNQLATLSAGSFTGDCGAADVVNSAGRLVITLLISTTAAQGITPETYGLTMTAWNATTGSQVWQTTLVPNQNQQILCPPSMDGIVADLWNFIATHNGQWGVFEQPLTAANGDLEYVAINLTTGKAYSNPNLVGVLGNNVVTGTGTSDDGSNQPTTLTVTTPGSWAPLGTAAGPGAQNGNPQLSGDLSGEGHFYPQDFAVTGYTGASGSSGDGIGAVATPDGSTLVAIYSDGNGNSWYRGYTLPSLKQLWSTPVPSGDTDQIAAISNGDLLITRAVTNGGGDTYLLNLNPKTGRQQWKTDVSSGSVCDLTSTQILALANNQLATLSAASGKQLSYATDPYQDAEGDYVCPSVVETGLSGIGLGNSATDTDAVLQLLTP
jgi:hypothetical protein